MSKTIISLLMALAAVLANLVSCGGDPLKENENIPLPENPPVEEETPTPVIEVADDCVVLYPASEGVSSSLEFSVSALGEDGTVTLVKGADISLALSFERTTGKGSVTITPEDTFGDESSFSITAANGEKRAEKEISVDCASIWPDLTTFSFDHGGGARKVLINANIPFTASSDESWLTVDDISAEGIVFSVRENPLRSARYATITVSDPDGRVKTPIYVEQTAPDPVEEITGERAALDEIYRALHGEDWSDSENWCTDAPLRQWYGVMTNTFKGEEHVTYLHLQCLGAHGTLPAAIGELRYLKELWIIGDEGISGSIPSSFGNLTELRDLSISGTSVSGPIPFCLSSLKKLEILGLDGNLLTGNIPLFLRDLPALYNFGFSQNCMDGKIDPSLTETLWWNTVDTSTGRKMGEENLARGQKEGHLLYLD